jgi:hypothetical protein
MFRAYRAADVIGDFAGGLTVSHLARPLVHDGQHFIEVRASRSAQWIRYPVDYVIGSKWQQAYATRRPIRAFSSFDSIQPQPISVVNYQSRHSGSSARISRAPSDSGGRDLPDGVCPVPHEPAESPQRDPPGGERRFPGGGHQLRNVPRSVARAHRADSIGQCLAALERGPAIALQPVAGGTVSGGVRPVSCAVGHPRRRGGGQRQLFGTNAVLRTYPAHLASNFA